MDVLKYNSPAESRNLTRDVCHPSLYGANSPLHLGKRPFPALLPPAESVGWFTLRGPRRGGMQNFSPAAWKTVPLQPLKYTRFHGRVHRNPRCLFHVFISKNINITPRCTRTHVSLDSSGCSTSSCSSTSEGGGEKWTDFRPREGRGV